MAIGGDGGPKTKLVRAALDRDAQRALAELEAAGLSCTEAVRRGLLTAAQQLRDHSRLESEVAVLADDKVDVAESLQVAAEMADLRGSW